jgi:hypothetical protein
MNEVNAFVQEHIKEHIKVAADHCAVRVAMGHHGRTEGELGTAG